MLLQPKMYVATNPPGNVPVKSLLILQSDSVQRGVECQQAAGRRGAVILYSERKKGSSRLKILSLQKLSFDENTASVA